MAAPPLSSDERKGTVTSWARLKWYQPLVQMSGGIGSCLIYALTYAFYRAYLLKLDDRTRASHIQRQKRLTLIVGSPLTPSLE